MRSLYMTLVGLSVLAASSAAQAKINITVDKDNQQMTVVQDGVEKYRWPVSSGDPAHETPNGSFQTFRMEEDHFSKEFDDAPMPNAIFFTKRGHAIHGTDSVSRLGTPASHGCVRLSRENAKTLYALVKEDGLLTTTVTLTGSASVAVARNPRPGKPTNVARRQQAVPEQASYDAAGNPVDLVPQPVAPGRRIARQIQPQDDDRYIYPADGSDNGQRYPAPPGYRRMTDAETQQYYANRGYYGRQYPPQAYAPRPYQPRGLFSDD
jgi:lipoprotein-anchoring transpeptidase ErfK/SrfK